MTEQTGLTERQKDYFWNKSKETLGAFVNVTSSDDDYRLALASMKLLEEAFSLRDTPLTRAQLSRCADEYIPEGSRVVTGIMERMVEITSEDMKRAAEGLLPIFEEALQQPSVRIAPRDSGWTRSK